LPFPYESHDRNKRYENNGSPSSDKAFACQEKCALRIRLRNKPHTIVARTTAATAGLKWPRMPAAIAATPPNTINKNSVSRRIANRNGDGKSNARFLVQPSRSWLKLRYIRV